MKLTGGPATILITDDGREVLKAVGVALPESNLLVVDIQESEDLGVWLRLQREDQVHCFLLLWQFVLGIDVAIGLGKITGLKG